MLALAPGAVFSGFIIIYLYGRGISPGRFNTGDYALVAICLYVLGNTVDEIYWIPYWALTYFSVYPEISKALLHYGPFVNLIFREFITFAGLILLFVALIKSAKASGNFAEASRILTMLLITLIIFFAMAVTVKIYIGTHT